jgi:predicted RNA binding protein YcfA (HicA-like mRNA interferase family)
MPKKIREIKAMLLGAGFTWRQAKGSHTVWKHRLLSQAITIARKDGADAPDYLESKVIKALNQLRDMGEIE